MTPASTAVDVPETTQLKSLLRSGGVEFLMEAHNGLSARIVQEAGFSGIWASGLSISAAMGVRDNNEASWTQVLEVVEFMSDATSIPILLDADTGYGNFNNVRRLVRKLEQRGVAGFCIEDKLFPKTNSFIGGERQELADIDVFCGKIKAAKDTQRDPDFCVVARVEAFIAGWGLGEALRRAEAYNEAGADAILMHSKIATPDEIVSFMEEWDDRCPVVVVPTTYYSTPTRVFREAGVSLVLWANHTLRASIRAMQHITRKIHEEQTLLTVEDEIVPVREVFRLQDAEELQEAERAYLPNLDAATRAIVLAASRGSRLGDLTADRPKTMVPVRGEPLLQRLVRHFNDSGIREVTVVTGYEPDAVDVAGIDTVRNERYEETREVHSLARAADALQGETVVSYGDILFKKYILHNLLNEDGDVVVVVDADHATRSRSEGYIDLVQCSHPLSEDYLDEPVHLLKADPELDLDQADGEWIGLMKVSAEGARWVREVVEELRDEGALETARMMELFRRLIAGGRDVRVVYVHGHWLNVNDLERLSRASDF